MSVVITFWDLVSIAIIGTILVAVGLFHCLRWIETVRCKHERFRETMSCHAICVSCGKDLGFIGTVRDSRRGEEV